MACVLATDADGVVWMESDSADWTPPNSWNGIALSAAVLTSEQEAEYRALPAPHGTVHFDGVHVTADPYVAPAPPPPPPNANQALIDSLNELTLTAGGEADAMRNAVIGVLQRQPSVPAL